MASKRNNVDIDMGGNAIVNCTTLNSMRPGERVYKYGQSVAGATTVAVFALNIIASVGTVASRPAPTNISGAVTVFQEADKVGLVSVATAGGSAQFRFGGAVYRPHATGRGGFDVTMRVGASDAAAVAGARCFYGFIAGVSTAIANVNPSTLFNIVGIGADSGETTLSIMTNAGAGTANKIALGSALPANTLGVDLYEIRFSCLPTALTTILYEITNQTTGVFTSGILSTNLPVAGVALEATAWRNNNATALSVSVDFAQVTIIKYL